MQNRDELLAGIKKTSKKKIVTIEDDRNNAVPEGWVTLQDVYDHPEEFTICGNNHLNKKGVGLCTSYLCYFKPFNDGTPTRQSIIDAADVNLKAYMSVGRKREEALKIKWNILVKPRD